MSAAARGRTCERGSSFEVDALMCAGLGKARGEVQVGDFRREQSCALNADLRYACLKMVGRWLADGDTNCPSYAPTRSALQVKYRATALGTDASRGRCCDHRQRGAERDHHRDETKGGELPTSKTLPSPSLYTVDERQFAWSSGGDNLSGAGSVGAQRV